MNHPEELSSPGRATVRDWVGLAVLVLPCLLVSMDGHVLNLAVPAIVADLRPSGAQLLWIVDGYVFLVGGSLLAMGAVGDRIGRRRLLLAGVTLFSASSLAAAFAGTATQLILARVLMGLAGASLMPSTLALIRNMFADRRQRTAALGVWSASFSLGGLLGPLVGGALMERFWWGSVFLVALPVTLLLLALGPRVLPEFRDPDATGFDLLGAAQSLLALLAIVYAIKSAAEGGALSRTGTAAMLAALLGAAFVRRQRRAAHPMIDPALFRSHAVRIALVSSTLTFFALYGTGIAIAQFLQWDIDLSPLQAGLWTVPGTLAYLAGTMIGPAAVSRFPPVRVIAAGLLVAGAGCALFTLVAVSAVNGLSVIVAGSIIFAVGLAPVYTLSTDLIMSNTRPEQAGTAGAVGETGAELGGALGIALLGSLGVAVYRHALIGAADGVSPGAAISPRHTLGDAIAIASTLPGPRGAHLLQQAHSAFEQAFATITGAASVTIIAGVAVITIISRRTPTAEPRRSPADTAAGPYSSTPIRDAAARSRRP
jgi:MFS transporter, DHA2 family, multidrug resistance protein